MPKAPTKRKSRGDGSAQSEEHRQDRPSAGATAPVGASGQADAGEADKGWFRKGNRFWEKRSSHGPKPKFLDPEVLAAACEEYFVWADDTLLEEPRPYAYAGSVTVRYIPKLRAMTIEGLCVFLDITWTTWARYRALPEFADACARVENIIRTQKFEGAAANIFNARIISRDLRLGEGTAIDSRAAQEQVKIDADHVRSKLLHDPAVRREEGEA